MKGLLRTAAALSTAAVAACASQPPLANEPLVWQPSIAPAFGVFDFSTLGQTRIQFAAFSDSVRQPQLIGENHQDSNNPRPVTTNGDVGAFVGGHMHELFSRSGLNIVEGNGDVVLSGEVRQFFVLEDKTYRGEVAVHLTLRNRAGKVVWEGGANGNATRSGHSYELDNYYEVLSDAVINATVSLLQDPDFRWALARR
jgi:hypothetical protein